jgi:hypothetical protein
MTVKLKPITDTCWLVIGDTDDNRIGLLTELKNEYILMVKGEKKKFINRKEVNTYFSEDIFDNLTEAREDLGTECNYFINGYPIDFAGANEVILKGNNLPLFSKKASSDVYYSAGYYCLHFPKNWMPAYCPKLPTLETYEYTGPFKTELEMRSSLAKFRKEKNAKK